LKSYDNFDGEQNLRSSAGKYRWRKISFEFSALPSVILGKPNRYFLFITLQREGIIFNFSLPAVDKEQFLY